MKPTPAFLSLLLIGCAGDDSGADGGTADTGTADTGTADTGTGTDTDTGPPPDPALLGCPAPGSLPFATEVSDWQTAEAQAIAEANPRIKDDSTDTLGNPDGLSANTFIAVDGTPAEGLLTLSGTKARTMNDLGLESNPLAGEPVSLWTFDGEWSSLGRTFTVDTGGYTFSGIEPSFGPLQPIYAVLESDGSCAAHYNFLLERGTKFVMSDIDGTLTADDAELFMQVADIDYDPLEITSASEMLNAWADKGYYVVYLTARVHSLRPETRAWLDSHGFPVGPVISSSSLVVGDSARDYKAAWVSRLIDDFGWDLNAAYGNAISDIDAYELAGVPKEITFTVGEDAGADGTQAIADLDYTTHLAEFVEPHPDA